MCLLALTRVFSLAQTNNPQFLFVAFWFPTTVVYYLARGSVHPWASWAVGVVAHLHGAANAFVSLMKKDVYWATKRFVTGRFLCPERYRRKRIEQLKKESMMTKKSTTTDRSEGVSTMVVSGLGKSSTSSLPPPPPPADSEYRGSSAMIRTSQLNQLGVITSTAFTVGGSSQLSVSDAASPRIGSDRKSLESSLPKIESTRMVGGSEGDHNGNDPNGEEQEDEFDVPDDTPEDDFVFEQNDNFEFDDEQDRATEQQNLANDV